MKYVIPRSVSLPTGFLRTGSLFAIVATLGNGLGYLYQVIVAKFVGVDSFAVFSALLGIFYISTLFGTSLRTGLSASIARSTAESGESAVVTAFIGTARRWALLLLAVPLIFAISAPALASALGSSSVVPVILIGLAIYGTLVFTLGLGLLQGLQMFRRLAFIGYMLPQTLKLVIGTTFLAAGWRVSGAIGALIASEFLPLIVVIWPWRRRLRDSARSSTTLERSFLKGTLSGLLLLPIIAIYTNLDVLLVVSLFDSSQAGAYAAAATLGKGIVFLGLAVSLVIAPRVANQVAAGEPVGSLIRNGIILTMVLCLPAVAIFYAAPDELIRILFDETFGEAADILGTYGLAMTGVALNITLASCALSLRQNRGILLGNVGMFVGIFALVIFSESLQDVVNFILGINLLMLAFFISLVVWGVKTTKTSEAKLLEADPAA